MLRAFLRNTLFERFPQVSGVCAGLAQATLAVWILTLTGRGGWLRPGPLIVAAAGLVLLNVWGVPRAGLARLQQPVAHTLTQGYLALSFSTIVVAGAVTASALLMTLAVLLLAPVGLSPEAGVALFEIGSVAVAVLAAAALAWGFWGEPRRFLVTRIRAPLRALDPVLAGLRIAHLSDLHLGNGLESARLARLVSEVNGLQPDLIAITGDLFDHDPAALVDGACGLASLEAPLGVYAVLGNHDLYTGADAVEASLAMHAPNIRLLRGESQRLRTPAPLYVAGVDDPGRDWTARGRGLPSIEKLAAASSNDGPVLLLVHRPDAFVQAAELGFSLVLSGHFHGGQIAVPLAEGRWNVAAVLSPFHRGLYRRGDSVLYVSRGIGFAGPRIRLGSPPEIALIELEHVGDSTPVHGSCSR